MPDKSHVYVVSAPSGCGKTSLLRALLQSPSGAQLSLCTSHTTRTRRAAEQDGVHYYFIDQQAFTHMVEAEEFVEWAEVFGNYYGTSRAEIDRLQNEQRKVVLEIDCQGAQQVMKLLNPVSIFIIPPSLKVLRKRLIQRGQDDERTIERRIAGAVAEIGQHSDFDYCIVNDDFDQALQALQGIVADAPPPDQQATRAVAERLLQE